MRKIYLHSWHGDFAKTQVLTESAYLGRCVLKADAPLRAFRCGCCPPQLVRIPRARWMRLLPLFRLYWCQGCGQKVLRTRTRQRFPYGSVYVLAGNAPRDISREDFAMVLRTSA